MNMYKVIFIVLVLCYTVRASQRNWHDTWKLMFCTVLSTYAAIWSCPFLTAKISSVFYLPFMESSVFVLFSLFLGSMLDKAINALDNYDAGLPKIIEQFIKYAGALVISYTSLTALVLALAMLPLSVVWESGAVALQDIARTETMRFSNICGTIAFKRPGIQEKKILDEMTKLYQVEKVIEHKEKSAYPDAEKPADAKQEGLLSKLNNILDDMSAPVKHNHRRRR